ncbi:MAG: Mur ligase domain-containing protein, partial [bacterium]
MVAEHAGLPSCPGGAWTTPVHFIGIGGVGMSGLATILLQRGVPVSGSDEAESPVLERLARLGATIATGHAVANVPAGTARVVYSSAVQPDNPELREAVRRGLPVCRRGEFLARLAEQYATVVAVGGSHGKTSTTAMIAHILRTAGHRPGFLIGGEMPGWPAPAAAGAGQILVTEVDESDGTQALLRSSHAVVTNVDDDHCWSLGGVTALEQCFSEFADRAQHLFTWQDATTTRLFAAHPAATFLTSAELPAALTLPVPG